MPTVTTNIYRRNVNAGLINLSANSFAVALLNGFATSGSSDIMKQVTNYSEISAFEVSGTGYSALPLSASTLSANSSQVVFWDGNDIIWNNVTINTYGLAIYRLSDGLVVGFIDFGELKQAVNGSISLSWNSNGIMNIF